MWAFISAWATAQLIKVVIQLIRDRRLDLRYLVAAGGMPSAHSASAVAVAASIGNQYGWDSGLFALAAFFAVVVMFDAQGVRQAVSKQAQVINLILDELSHGQPLREERLKELLGHTPVEVFVGAGIGLLMAWVWTR